MHRFRVVTGLVLLLVLSNDVRATNVFNLEGFGPISRALGGAGVAHDIGSAALMYNPATLSLMEDGSTVHVGLDLIGTTIETTNQSTGAKAHSSKGSLSRNRGPIYFAPEVAYTTKSGALNYGIGVFAQGGLGTEYGGNSFLSTTATSNVSTELENSSRLLNLRIPLGASYRIDDRLTIGGSLDVVWTQMNLEMLLDVSQVASLAADGRVSGSLVPVLLGIPGLSGAHFSLTKNQIVGGGVDGWGFGAKIGMTYLVADTTRIGLAYNFRTNVDDLSGSAILTAVDSSNNHVSLSGSFKIRNFQNPAQLSVGLSHAVSDRLEVVADIQRVFWKDVMEDIDVGFVQDGTNSNIDVLLPQNYKDINIYTLGAEYQYNKKWVFRGGISHSDQALDESFLLAVIPAYIRNHVTGGFSYSWSENSELNFAISFALNESMKNSYQPNTAVPIKSEHRQINAVVSYAYRY